MLPGAAGTKGRYTNQSIKMCANLEVIRKAYKSDEDIQTEMKNGLEHRLDIDQTWNEKYTFLCCGDYNGPLIGHRTEKCMYVVGIYDDKMVERFVIEGATHLITRYIDRRRCEEKNWELERKEEFLKVKTETEIPNPRPNYLVSKNKCQDDQDKILTFGTMK